MQVRNVSKTDVVLSMIVYQYKNVTQHSLEYGYTYTGKTMNEKTRYRDHTDMTSTNKHMKAARLRGDKFEYTVLERFTLSYSNDFKTGEAVENLQNFLQEVADCECKHTPSLWPDGAYNIKDEGNRKHFLEMMLRKQREFYDEKWKKEIVPKLLEYYKEKGEIWSIPQDYPTIGNVVQNMRSRRNFIGKHNPRGAKRLAWLKTMKWAESKNEGKWRYVLKPAFLKYYEENGEIWSVPQDYPIIGRIVSKMRSRRFFIGNSDPRGAKRLACLKRMKWAESYNEGYIRYVIKPALLDYFKKNGEISSITRKNCPVGRIISDIRISGNYIGRWKPNPTKAEKKLKLWMENLGLIYDTRNRRHHMEKCLLKEKANLIIFTINHVIWMRRLQYQNTHGNLKDAPTFLFGRPLRRRINKIVNKSRRLHRRKYKLTQNDYSILD